MSLPHDDTNRPTVTERLATVGLGGSLAQPARSLAALRFALDGAAQAGAATTLFDLRELDLPMYNPEHEGEPPPAASTLIEACHVAALARLARTAVPA